MENIYFIGKLIEMNEIKLINIKSALLNYLNNEDVDWIKVNELTNKSINIINNIKDLRIKKINIIKEFH